jgi:hypothetical protein
MVKNSVIFYTPKGVHKTEDSMENMILGILSEIAQYDNKIRAERSRVGKLEKVKLNYFRGGDCLFGYKLQHDGIGNRLVENEEESKWVKFIFQEYTAGRKLTEIKEILEANNVKTRRGNKEWSLGTLQLMIRTKTYTGIDVFYDKKSKETVINKIPQVISDKLFAEANLKRQAILLRKGQMNKTTKFYLFRDFLFCSCGKPMSGRIKHDGREQLYYCPLPERKFNSTIPQDVTDCTMKRSLDIPTADEEIWQVIKDTLSNSIQIREQFEGKNLLGKGLKGKEFKKYIAKINTDIVQLEIEKAKVESALIKTEKENALAQYSNEAVYKGLKHELNKSLTEKSIKIESARAELNHLNDKDAWLEWLDELASVMKDGQDLTPIRKRKFLNLILRRIDVSHDAATKLHRLDIKFRLPMLSDLDGIVKHNPTKNINLDRRVKYFQLPKTPIKSARISSKNTFHSTVAKFSSLDGNADGQIYENNRFYITLNVVYHSATLWQAPYSEYQQFLFDTINEMYQQGNSYIKIAQWFNDNNHLTPRGSVFKPNHAWSIHMKKQKSINRFARTYQPSITNIGIDIIP